MRRLLVLILAVGAVLRLAQVGHGLPYLDYWDEPQTVSTALNMMKSGDPDPHYFNYGSLLIYANVAASAVYDLLFTHGLGAVVTSRETGWHWSISHPGFYEAGRILNALFALATIWLTYLTGRRLMPPPHALGAAALVAVSAFHIEYSILVTPDVPVGFFVMAVIWASLVYFDTGRVPALWAAAISVGLAGATKYNAAPIALVPLLSVVLRQDIKISRLTIVFLVPALAFLAAMPYAVLDYKLFVSQTLFEYKHYSEMGHGGGAHDAKPGLGHLLMILRSFPDHEGWLVCGFALIGIARVRGAKYPILLIHPAFYLLLMSLMKVEFDRNYIQLYPILALLAMRGVEATTVRAPKAAWLLMTGMALVGLATAVPAAVETWKRTDSRSEAITYLDKLDDDRPVAIADMLRVQPQDLVRLRRPYRVVPLGEAIELACAAPPRAATLMLPDKMIAVLPTGLTNEALLHDTRLLDAIGDKGGKVLGDAVLTDAMTVSPKLHVIPPDAAPPPGC